MNKGAFLESLEAAIINNSNLECEGDDTCLFVGVENVERLKEELIVTFEDGKQLAVSLTIKK